MINEYIAKAMKSKNRVELRAYKNLKAEIQKILTSKNAPEYSDNLLIQVCIKYCKTLEDSISSFSKADREDLVLEYREELEVLKKLLPEPVNESQIYFEVEKWISENISNHISEFRNYYPSEENRLFIPKKDMGKVFKHLKNKFPLADGKIISEIVKKYIA